MKRAADWIGRRPFLSAGVGLILGIVLSDRLSPAPSVVWSGLAAAALATAILRRHPQARIVAIAWLGIQVGLARHEAAERHPADDVASRTFGGEVAEVAGRVVEPLRLYKDPSRPLDEVDERHAEERGAFTIESGSIRVGTEMCRGRVLVQFYEHTLTSLPIGTDVRVTGKLRTPRGQTNPGGYDRRKMLLRRGIGAVLSVSRSDAIVPGEPSPPFTERVRSAIRTRIGASTRPDAAAFLSALILGVREDLPSDLVDSLQRSGTAHFLAISGQNLVILVGILYWILFACGLRGAKLNLALIALLFAYSALTGWPVSVVRAFLMTLAVLLATVLWRRSDTVNSLSAAACAILLADPVQVFDVGFQLSFLAVLGIIAISPVFHDWLATPSEGSVVAWGVSLVRAALAVSMSAWLATAPIVLANFNLVTPIILVANLVLLPLMFVEMVLGLVLIPLAFAAPPVAGWIGVVAAGVLDLLALVSKGLTRLPGSWLYLPALSPAPALVYYALLALWAAWTRSRPASWKPWGCAVFAAMLAFPALRPHRPPTQETTMLDVGRGSSQVVQFPDGRVIVFDCGSLSCRDAGASVTAPFLWSRRLTKIDVLFLSHPDADHVNGALSLVDRFRVGTVAVSRYFGLTPDGARVLEAVRGRGVGVTIVGRDGAEPVEIGPGLAILGPPVWEKYGAIPAQTNECSVVLRAGDVLFTGDIEEVGVEELLALGPDLKARVFVAPHHGKMHRRHAELLDAVGPEITLVSAPEGYYAREVMERLVAKSRTLFTGRDGAVTISNPK